jgi:hypothetical protein
MDPRIPPLEDPSPRAPRVPSIDTSALPDYAKTAEEWWQITDCIWPAILDIFERVDMSARTTEAETWRAARDPKLAALLEEAWAAAPDAYFIHTWQQWGRFCDLCSEQHVLFPEEEE